MAKLSADKKSVTVQEGDTLSGIAAKYKTESGGKTWQQLATLNKLKNPNLIVIGQVLKLTDGGSSSTTGSSTNSNAPTIKQFGLLTTSSNTLLATWDWSKSNTASYKVQWAYDVGNGIWLLGSDTSISVDKDDPSMSRQSMYTIPDTARKVRFKVKPVAETKKDSKGNESVYWTANWSTTKTWTDGTPLVTPSTPNVTIEKYKLTASLDNLNIPNATAIEFQVVKNNTAKAFVTSKPVDIVSTHASYSCNVDAGGEYKVRCRAYNSKDKTYSEWSTYSSGVKTIPAKPAGITSIKATSETSIYLEWSKSEVADTYDIEYANKKGSFDNSDETQTKTGIEFTHFELTGLDAGKEYFLRVRATNDKGSSDWSDIKSVIIGTKPAPPTTWSSTTTAVTSEPLSLYWVHNAEDGSSQKFAELRLTINDQLLAPDITIKNFTDDEKKDLTRSCQIDTLNGYVRWEDDTGLREKFLGVTFAEGVKLEWQVRTCGITNEYSDWSTPRTVDIYATPTLELRLTDLENAAVDTIEAFPFYVYAIAGPNTQTPTGYHLSVISNEIYETVDNVGNPKFINVGDEVYSKYFDTRDALLVEFSANNIDLENNVRYTAKCVVSMNSGLTAESSVDFTVAWTDVACLPNAEIGINSEDLTASICPYCAISNLVYYKVERSGYKYIQTNDTVPSMWGEVVKKVKTDTGLPVYLGETAEGEEIYFCSVEESTPVTNVWMSVYRREFDGRFTEIATGLDGEKHTTVTDPHPALDYARYRIVAASKDTGAISYYDPPGHPVNGKAVVIQWDEAWSQFDTTEDAPLEQPPWSGSMLKLPYNIDVSDNNSMDVTLIEYAGRSHPVSYYGTQLGSSATWNVDIPKSDIDTLYALRRLAIWMGDVYVREPSGSGYWANVSVSFTQKHRDLIVPVSIGIKRVEGGM